MDENTLFKQQKDNPLIAPSLQSPNQPSQPIQSSQQTQPTEPVQPAQASSEETPPPSLPQLTSNRPMHKRDNAGLLRLILGIVAVVIITFLVILFLPKGGLQLQKVKLVWWGLWEDSRVMQPLITDFEKEHPNITIEYIKQDKDHYADRLLTRIKNGTGPDIFRYHNTWYPMFSEVLLPFSSDVISQDAFKKSFYPVMQADLTNNGAIYGIPLGADSLSLFVNTDLLKAAGVKPPTNWDEFVNASKKLTVKDANGKIKTAGAALGTYGNVTHAADIMALLFAQQGVTMKNISSSAQDQSDVLDFYTSFAKGDQNTWDTTLDDSLLSFSKGNLAMYFGYSWDIFAIQKLNKNLPFKVYAVPSLYNKTMTVASYWVEGVAAKSTHRNEALLFMQYISKKETEQKFYTETAKIRAFGEPYARSDLAVSLKSSTIVYPFVSQLKNVTSSIFASDTFDGNGGINTLSNTYLENAVNSIITDNSSSGSVVQTLDEGLAQVFTKY